MANNSESSFLAFLLGGAIGALIGVLYAPRNGKETRAALSSMLDELQEKGVEEFSKTKSKAREAYKEGKGFVGEEKERLAEAITAGKKVYKKQS